MVLLFQAIVYYGGSQGSIYLREKIGMSMNCLVMEYSGPLVIYKTTLWDDIASGLILQGGLLTQVKCKTYQCF